MKPDIPQPHFGSSPGGWLMALSRRFDRALHEDLLAAEAALLTCRYEGSWLEVYDVHYLTPLVRYWNRLHQELYWRLHGCFFAWHARRGKHVLEEAGRVADEDDL